MKKFLASIGLLSALLLSTGIEAADAPKASAQPEPKLLVEGKTWSAYSVAQKGGAICYLIGHPEKIEPAGIKPESAEAKITHRSAEKKFNEVSFVAGTPYKDKSDVDLDVDSKKFKLFTDKDTAWATDAATDKAISDAMFKGKALIVKGTSAKGTAITENYSLTGLAAAVKEIDKACGVKR